MPDRALATYPSLKGRSVFISGGASGIGAAMVRAFAGQGAKVAFVDIAEEAGNQLSRELTDAGGEVLFIRADVTDTAAFQGAIREGAERFGPITVLVNNAANDTRHDWRAETSESWDQKIATNLKHYFFAIQAVAPGMIEAGVGSIINFSSTSWVIGARDLPVYETAKAAAIGMTRSFARELGKQGVRVNVVLPGWVMTERQLKLWVDAAGERTIDDRQCLPGRIQPDDLARTVLFLASDDSAMITSQSIVVDAGWADGV